MKPRLRPCRPCLQGATQPAEDAPQPQGGSVAAEVAALNAELCAQLDGIIEDSPDKKSRRGGAGRGSIRGSIMLPRLPTSYMAVCPGLVACRAYPACCCRALACKPHSALAALPPAACRGDGQSLRDKLLQSWDGRSYYERLLEMSQGREQGGQGSKDERQRRQQQPQAVQQQPPPP